MFVAGPARFVATEPNATRLPSPLISESPEPLFPASLLAPLARLT